MKTLIINSFIYITLLVTGNSVMAQTAALTIEVKGIKEAKGKILVAVKDSEDPDKMIYEMITVKQKGNATITLQNVPVGKVDVSLFQDMNDNFKLDIDEANIPVEPCYNKEKVKIKEGDNKLAVTLINVKEMISQQP